MRPNPHIARLRGDRAPQLGAQRRLEAIRDAWLAGAAAPAIAELEAYGAGHPLSDLPMLATWFSQPGAAHRAVSSLIGPLARELATFPLAMVPFRHQVAGGIAVLQLATRGGAALSLITYDRDSCRTACGDTIASFADGERHECVLSGAADGVMLELIEAPDGALAVDVEPCRIVAGELFHYHGPDCTKMRERVHGGLTLLRLSREARDPVATRNVRIGDGVVVHRSSGDRGESEREMMLAVLGAMRHPGAADIARTMTRQGSDHLRWQALRECLALDTATGFAALSVMAADAQDSLSAAAGALRAQLLETYPQLHQLEGTPCPA